MCICLCISIRLDKYIIYYGSYDVMKLQLNLIELLDNWHEL